MDSPAAEKLEPTLSSPVKQQCLTYQDMQQQQYPPMKHENRYQRAPSIHPLVQQMQNIGPHYAPYPTQKESKLQLPLYNSCNSYTEWRARCVLECTIHCTINTLTTKSRDGTKLMFSSLPSKEENQILYAAMAKALGKEIGKIVTTKDSERANGVALWRALDSHFMQKHYSFLFHKKLKKDFDSLTKAPTKTFKAYSIRFQEKLDLLRHNNVPMPT